MNRGVGFATKTQSHEDFLGTVFSSCFRVFVATPNVVRTRTARCLLGGSSMSHERIFFGKTGEDLACRELERRGYAILAKRYRRRIGEIDIVCRDGRTVVFVEVKARQGKAFGEAAEAVTASKRRRIAALASDYLTRHHLSDHPCRFDVVSIQMRAGEPMIEVFQAAFDATGD